MKNKKEEKTIIKLNEKLITPKELEEKKKQIEKMKGAKLIEIKPNEFKIKLED